MSSDIYVFCQLFYPELISSGQTVTELCESLAKKGKKITVYCAQPTVVSSEKVEKEILYKTITIKRLSSTQFSKLNLVGKLINHISFTFSCIFKLFSLPKNATLIIFTNPPILPLIVRFVQLFKAFDYHLVLFDLYPQTLIAANILKSNSILAKFYQYLISSTYIRAKTLISIGRCMKSVVDNCIGSNDNSIYIPIWADTAHIQHPKSNLNFKREWGLENKFIVGYSGNLAKFHPIETIIYAAEKLQSTTDIVFLFVGEGAKKSWAESYCKTRNMSNCIFKDYVCRKDLPNLLHSFDCGLVGLLNENTGFSVPSKAMGLLSAGIPILASVNNDCEINLILKEFNCGLQSNPEDSNGLVKNILNLYTNKEEIKLMSENALKAVKTTFNLTNITEDYLQILSKS